MLKKYFVAALILLGFHGSFSQAGKKLSMLAGAASVNITPLSPVPMSGYANRDQPSKGVHDDIFARAFIFDDGKTKVCIIQADLIGFSFEFADEVHKEIEKKTGIPKENSMLVAVHNHGAPVTRTYGEPATDNLTAYLADLKKKLVDVAVEAHAKRMPALVGTGKGQCTMNINRRARHGEGGIWLGRNPDGPCDHEVDILRIDNLQGETIGMMVNWPCHATVGGQENYLITGDWPGATVRYVEQNFKAGIPIGITAGASGDINPIYGPHNNFNEMNAMGLVLGEEIVRVTKTIVPQKVLSLSVIHREIEVPGKEKSASRMPDEKIVPGAPVKLRFSAIRIGSVVMAGISGELMTEMGMLVKEQSPYRNTTIITHCNGSSGYLCTDAAYREGGYEPMVSKTMPGVEKIIVDNLLAMLNEL
jgi:hypothetical protein